MKGSRLVTETRTLVYPKGLVCPEDLVTFVPFAGFSRQWKELGLSDEDLEALEVLLMIDPKRGSLISRTGSLRIIRFTPPEWNVGKSGALRIGYSYSEHESIVLLVVAHANHGKANLSRVERQEFKELLGRAWQYVLQEG